jgi:hypothetical protein
VIPESQTPDGSLEFQTIDRFVCKSLITAPEPRTLINRYLRTRATEASRAPRPTSCKNRCSQSSCRVQGSGFRVFALYHHVGSGRYPGPLLLASFVKHGRKERQREGGRRRRGGAGGVDGDCRGGIWCKKPQCECVQNLSASVVTACRFVSTQ